jgi:hypothetical protein
MSTGTDISALYHEFTAALTEVLAENAVGPARRGRLARARAAVKKQLEYSEHQYFCGGDRIQKLKPYKTSVARPAPRNCYNTAAIKVKRLRTRALLASPVLGDLEALASAYLDGEVVRKGIAPCLSAPLIQVLQNR